MPFSSDAFNATRINSATTTTVKSSGGVMRGFYCATTTSGTVSISDGATALSGTITPTAGTFVEFPAAFGTSLKIVTGNTIDITVFWL